MNFYRGEKMKVLVTGSVHLYKDKAGNFYSPTVYNYDFLKRYLAVFDEVMLMGKVKPDAYKSEMKMQKVSGKGVTIIELPWYRGIRGMAKKILRLAGIMREEGKRSDCYIFRIAQIESFLMYMFRKRNRPYAVEIVNNPKTLEELSEFQKIINGFFIKRMIKSASGVSYVTREMLQKEYPADEQHQFVSSYSSAEIKEEDIATAPKRYTGQEPLRIVHVSNAIESDGKGHVTLIDAISRIKVEGYFVQVYFVGEGTKIPEFEEYAKEKGTEDIVHFIGRISGHEKMLEFLKTCDLMVFPSKSEGLPRTIIEAMAVGLPCIASNVGGLPELLDKEYLFAPTDVQGIVEKICYLINNPQELENMSKKNIANVKQYSSDLLMKRRITFYENLKQCVKEDK